jgi:hypothetical protein
VREIAKKDGVRLHHFKITVLNRMFLTILTGSFYLLGELFLWGALPSKRGAPKSPKKVSLVRLGRGSFKEGVTE